MHDVATNNEMKKYTCLCLAMYTNVGPASMQHGCDTFPPNKYFTLIHVTFAIIHVIRRHSENVVKDKRIIHKLTCKYETPAA